MSGRPTDYDPKYCEEIIEHFDIEPNKMSFRTITKKDGTTIEEPVEIPANLPTFASFARKIGIHRETLLNWCEVHKEFFDAYKRAKEMQDDILTTNALKSLYNPQYSQFFAKNALDDRYKDKTEVKNTVSVSDLIKQQEGVN